MNQKPNKGSVAQLYMDVLDEILYVVVAMPQVGYKWPP